MAWLLRLLSVLAAAITSLFVALDALNFGIIEIPVTVTLAVGAAVIAVGSGRYAARFEHTGRAHVPRRQLICST
jgi:hypothetical protein